MSYETVLTERRGETSGILWVTLNRPEKLNALSMTLFDELRQVFQQARTDRSVRCVVITGAGRGFCAGADFSGGPAKELVYASQESATDLEGARLFFRNESETYIALKRLDVPVIASVNGVCVGAGLDMVAHCDMAVASTAARFQVAYVKRGLFADLGGFYSLPRIIGWRKAMEMMTTGRFMAAEEAHAAGLTNYLVSPDELEAKTMELALAVEAGPPLGQKLGKILAYRTQGMDFESALEFSGIALGTTAMSEDRNEGRRSFAEKREPKFTGR
ncbi:MAG TPA: enoyl-CoA hydratase/isomerase family protein [Tepidiformaceae bacterium]|nr:enoyl-CoA hydratase/isomerase family protein [Tepidiformaceae bacterium]